ncbi:hypothetical protein C8R44DRAFT_892049 [Mycena epipterygia]|nr:hypothetical protein C8R44DRAFT_892049 [Mycena epipterygia]
MSLSACQRLPNIILRNWPDAIDPVLLDFGRAVLEEPDDDSESVGYYDEVEQARRMLEDWMFSWMKKEEELKQQIAEDNR